MRWPKALLALALAGQMGCAACVIRPDALEGAALGQAHCRRDPITGAAEIQGGAISATGAGFLGSIVGAAFRALFLP